MLGSLQEILAGLLEVLQRKIVLSSLIVIAGVILGIVIGRINQKILEGTGVSQSVEGTSFERTARSFGTSTISLIASISTWFVIGVSILIALSIANIQLTQLFWLRVTTFLPHLFLAIIVLIVGIIIGDKVELLAKEQLRGIKLPQISLIPTLLKYSVIYASALIALGQVGIATSALILLLGAYLFGFIFLGGLALQDLLSSGAAGVYLLLTQPYGIGDEVIIDDYQGIVQELTVFVTWIENDGVEYVIPNRRVLKSGVVCKRRG